MINKVDQILQNGRFQSPICASQPLGHIFEYFDNIAQKVSIRISFKLLDMLIKNNITIDQTINPLSKLSQINQSLWSISFNPNNTIMYSLMYFINILSRNQIFPPIRRSTNLHLTIKTICTIDVTERYLICGSSWENSLNRMFTISELFNAKSMFSHLNKEYFTKWNLRLLGLEPSISIYLTRWLTSKWISHNDGYHNRTAKYLKDFPSNLV